MKNLPLQQIALHISPESEEAISVLWENLLGQAPSIYTDAETGEMTATVYLEPKQWNASLRQKLSAGLGEIEKCGLNLASKRISVRKIKREDWAESWKRHFKPMEIGKKLLIKPSWSKRQPKKGQAVVILDPGLSFGTGQHATTSFCLRQIAKSSAGVPPASGDGGRSRSRRRDARATLPPSFLDIGTGSGILAIAAAKLGYGPIEAFDFDPESVRVSRENAEVNQVQKQLYLAQKDLCKLPVGSQKKFDLVCANLIYDLLLDQAGKIVNRVSPGGKLVLAGILQKQFAEVRSRFEELGLRLTATTIEKEWQSGLFIFSV